MSYVDRVIQPDETVVYRAPLHWILYAPGVSLAILGLVVAAGGTLFAPGTPSESGMGGMGLARMAVISAGGLLVFVGLLKVAGSFIRRVTTEIAITSKRVIYKTGLVRRVTSEISVDKIETVLVEQGVLGRVLNFGTVVVRGTGGGLEPVADIGHPLEFRSKLTAR
jgi:uncharacterized membrane protein YdbT with pleckstrin-like domain